MQKERVKLIALIPTTVISTVILFEKLNILKFLMKIPRLVQIMARVLMIESSLIWRWGWPKWRYSYHDNRDK